MVTPPGSCSFCSLRESWDSNSVGENPIDKELDELLDKMDEIIPSREPSPAPTRVIKTSHSYVMPLRP